MPEPHAIDLMFNDDPVCPYCGATQSDAWELDGEDGTTDCGECDREFRWSRHVEVTYTTAKVEKTDA